MKLSRALFLASFLLALASLSSCISHRIEIGTTLGMDNGHMTGSITARIPISMPINREGSK